MIPPHFRGRIAVIVVALLVVIALGIRLVTDRSQPRAAPAAVTADDSHVPIPEPPAAPPANNLPQMHEVDLQINLRQSADSIPMRVQAAEMATGIGDLWRAEALLRSALAHDSKDRQARALLADVLNKEERLQEARALYLQLNSEDPRDLTPYLNLQSVAAKEKKLAEAWKWLAAGAEKCAQTPENMIALAHRYYSLNDIAAARKTLARGTALAPTDISMQLQNAILRFQQSEFEESRAILESLLQAHPDNEPAMRLLAGILVNPGYKRQDAARANQLLERAVALDPKDANVYSHAAAVYRQMRLYRMAAEAYVAYLTLEPRNASARYELGQVYDQLQRKDLAQEQFKLSRQIRGREERITPLSSVVSQHPLLASAHAALATELEQNGDYASALRELQIAAGLAPKDSRIAAKQKQLYKTLGWPLPVRTS